MKTLPQNDVGARFNLRGSRDTYRWHERPELSFRKEGFADEIIRLRHTGWYCDTIQSETTRGIVFRLPSGRGFLAGCTDPWNDGPVILEDCVYSDRDTAARCADSIAQYYGEWCVEDDERFQREQREQDEREIESAGMELEVA